MTSRANSHDESTRSFRKEALILGLVSLAGPLAMNMYVPAFPEMARALGTTSATIQLSLTSYLAALAIGQNIFGPLSTGSEESRRSTRAFFSSSSRR